MIELRNVTRIYAAAPGRGRVDTVALDDVTLTIPPGGVWGVVGPNGAGKTTLFGLILGFIHPTKGRVRIDGLEPRRYLRRHGAAYLPERFRLPPEWTVGDALRALADLEGLKGDAARQRVATVLERFGLEPHAKKPIGALSRGLNQRLGLAQALLGDRRLVVLDEPTEGLDPLWRIRFRDVVAELRNAERTILVASHDLAEVERIADRVVLLEGGRVKEIMDVTPAATGKTGYRITLAAPSPAMAEAFPGAVALPDAGPATYLVHVADAKELSTRLAALLDAGAVVAEVTQVGEPLEERVRRALDPEVAR